MRPWGANILLTALATGGAVLEGVLLDDGFCDCRDPLGVSAGIAPGPLLALVISETLRYGRKAGVKVALAHVISDLPIVGVTLYVLARLSAFNLILGIISLAGGFVLLYMGYESLGAEGLQMDLQGVNPKSFKKGIIVNVLNPHPYLFWVSIGGPMTLKVWDAGPFAAGGFVAGFYVFLVGSKILLTVLAARYRSLLTGRFYVCTMRILGLTLLIFAWVLFRNGLNLMGF